jgi:hypothetical protein
MSAVTAVAVTVATVATKEAEANANTYAWHRVIGGRIAIRHIAIGAIAVIAGRIPVMAWPPIVAGRRIRVRGYWLIKAIAVWRGVDATREAGR